jgi:hypothetical protein
VLVPIICLVRQKLSTVFAGKYNMDTQLTPQQERLAVEIASSLDDMDSLSAHRRYVLIYSEAILRKVLMKALAVPAEKIRRTRGALFTSLLKGYAGNNRP